MKIGKGISLRGNIYWYAYMEKGVRYRFSLQTSDLGEAVRRAQEIRRQPQFATKSPMAAEVERFLQQKTRLNEFSKATERVHGAAVKEFSDKLLGLPLSAIRLHHVEGHYRALQNRVAETTAQIHMRAIKAFFSWCVKDRVLMSNPCDGLKLAKVDQPARLRFCTAAQRDQLIAEAPNDDVRFILFAGFHCGLRKNEIIEARAGWFDLNPDGACHVENTPTFRIKDGERRFIPLTEQFRKFLVGYLAGRKPDDFALKPEVAHGRGTYRYDFSKPFNDLVESKGMSWVTAHVMRHTFASLLVQAGVSVFKVARWLGDGVEVVERHYAHLAPQDRDIEKML